VILAALVVYCLLGGCTRQRAGIALALLWSSWILGAVWLVGWYWPFGP
jgi:hypothetical protein